ncbi:hypothetical protein ACVW0K_007367 [Streptomyces filamentosus]
MLPQPWDDYSPLAQGWTLRPVGGGLHLHLLPARAGMDPPGGVRWTRSPSASRSRGDGPSNSAFAVDITVCSPLARGWPHHQAPGGFFDMLLPARAGMDPRCPSTRWRRGPAPRSRGDGPDLARVVVGPNGCSPLAWGWTRSRDVPGHPDVLLPARAGMDPAAGLPARRCTSAPCSRGDGPETHHWVEGNNGCSPRPRGWTGDAKNQDIPGLLLPARGDGPLTPPREPELRACSPRPRGWTPDGAAAHVLRHLLPAPAGMDPPPSTSRARCGTAPRACGDGPEPRRTPSWTCCLLPALAWMVGGGVGGRFVCFGESCLRSDCRGVELQVRKTAPRSRGDGPIPPKAPPPKHACSPLARGWTLQRMTERPGFPLLPARAGMDPPGSN